VKQKVKVKQNKEGLRATLTLGDLTNLIVGRAAKDRRHEIREARSDIFDHFGKGRREAARRLMAGTTPGRVAIQRITSIQKLTGPYGAEAWYQRFLSAHRAGAAPDGIRLSDWEAIAGAWASHEVEKVLQREMPTELVVVEQIAFRQWRSGHFDHLYREEPQGCPDEITLLPRGFRPRPGKKTTSPKGSPAPKGLWDEAEERPVEWTAREKAKGIPRKIAGGNHLENTVHIPEACAQQLREDRASQLLDLKKVDPKKVEKLKFSSDHWSSPPLPKKEAVDIQGDSIEAEADEKEAGQGRDIDVDGAETASAAGAEPRA
jgi:hypothetical protein